MKTEDILFEPVWKESQDQINALKQALKNGNWILCLGAGVSISAGLPNWYGLLAKITARLLPLQRSGKYYGEDEAYDRSIEDFYRDLKYDAVFLNKMKDAFEGKYAKVFEHINVLESAEYIRNFVESSVRSPESNKNEKNEGIQKNIDWYMNYFISEAFKQDIVVDKSNENLKRSTLGAVAGLMKSEDGALIHNAITYNYDNLLESYLRNICDCKREEVHSITKSEELREFDDQSGWNIYHVHGRIPVVDKDIEKKSDSVILSESDYYQEERINYSWTNILQSYAIAKANLIFIGFSGADYNFRRILKYVDKEEVSSHGRYIFFSVDDIVNAVFAEELKSGEDLSECIKIMNITNSKYAFEKMFINYLVHAQTLYWKNHGLEVIWSSHEELPGVLESLYMKKS